MRNKSLILKTLAPILGTGALVGSMITTTSCSAAKAIQFNGIEDFAEYAGRRLDTKQYISSASSTMTNSDFLDQFYKDIKNAGSNRSNVLVDGIFSTYLRNALNSCNSMVDQFNSSITSPDKKIKHLDSVNDCIDVMWKGFEYAKNDGVFNGAKYLPEIWTFLNSLRIEISPVTIKQESIDIYNMETKKYLFDQKVDLLSSSILLSSSYSNDHINFNDLRNETPKIAAQILDYQSYITQLQINDDNANFLFCTNLFLNLASDFILSFNNSLYSERILMLEQYGINGIDLNFNLKIEINNLPIFGFFYVSEDEAKQERSGNYGTFLTMSNKDIIDTINTDGPTAFATQTENTIIEATGFNISFSNSFLSMFSNTLTNKLFSLLMDSSMTSIGENQFIESVIQFDSILHPINND